MLQEKPGGKTYKQMSLSTLFLLMKAVATLINHGLMVELKVKHVFMMMPLKVRKNAVV